MASCPTSKRFGWLARLGWFAGLWLASVSALGIVGLLIRMVLRT
ncbi:DUF2474 family protein [Sphingomonas sp. H39-1-10]|nr:DUF2474 family protein [Sphingomonas pollutisoli]MDF0489939.1 DUF2474 family protein [Sphingomonas pollutisoli]SDA36942.1 Protein of unknown function [Sphingomonas sp. NFR15]